MTAPISIGDRVCNVGHMAGTVRAFVEPKPGWRRALVAWQDGTEQYVDVEKLSPAPIDADLDACTCGGALRWDPDVRGETCGGMHLVGGLVCAACGTAFISEKSRPDDDRERQVDERKADARRRRRAAKQEGGAP